MKNVYVKSYFPELLLRRMRCHPLRPGSPKGQITKQLAEDLEDPNQRGFLFLSSKEQLEYYFCTPACFTKYVEKMEAVSAHRRKQWLEQQVKLDNDPYRRSQGSRKHVDW